MSAPSSADGAPPVEGQGGRSLADRVLDLVVYAPIGAVDLVLHGAPEAAEAGRRRIEQQVRTARWVGQMAVTVGRSRLQAALATRRARPTPPVAAPEASPASAHPESAMCPEPFAGYDTLPAVDLVPMLARLTRPELEAVRKYESAVRARRTVLARVEQLLAA